MSSVNHLLVTQREAILGLASNLYHPLVAISGKPEIGTGVFIGFFSEINATGARVLIGDGCDIASFVSINVADSHLRCIGLADQIVRGDITLGNGVFVGSHAVILGGSTIGDRCVVAAGSVVKDLTAPAESLISGNPAVCRPGYYSSRYPCRES